MSTLVRNLTQAYPDAAATPPLVLPSAAEISLFGNTSLKNWWRADAGFDATALKWRCRKTDAALVPTKGSYFPTRLRAVGGVASSVVTAGGSGYTAPTVTFSAPPTCAIEATAYATLSGSTVGAITVYGGGGSGYTAAPLVVITAPPAGGTQATAHATVSGGAVTGVVIDNAGSGYTSAPTVSLSGGTTAKGTATVVSGAVTAIVMTNPGSGYTSSPSVTITGAGTGATATATLGTSNHYGGRQALRFGNGAGLNGAMYDGRLNLLPINSNFTVITVGRVGPGGDAGYMWGNGLTTSTTGGIGHQLNDSTGQVSTSGNYGSGSSTILNTGTSTWTNASGPYVDIFSFDDDGNTAKQYLSAGNFNATNAALNSDLHVTNGEFHVGDIGPVATTQSAAYYPEGGDVSEVMLFNAALHLTANAALLAAVQAYLADRYSIVVP